MIIITTFTENRSEHIRKHTKESLILELKQEGQFVVPIYNNKLVEVSYVTVQASYVRYIGSLLKTSLEWSKRLCIPISICMLTGNLKYERKYQMNDLKR